MDRTYWHKQAIDTPLFPDLMWSRPENKRQAGKLLIIGGNLHGFSAPAEAYQETVKAGIGTCRVLLPVSLQKTAGRLLENVEYAPSTPSGSFSREALGTYMENAAWSDGVLLAGDFGRNSETAILIESFLNKSPGMITMVKDAADYVIADPNATLNRPETLLVLTIAQLQKFYTHAKIPEAITFGMDLLHLVDTLHKLTSSKPITVIVKHLDQIVVAHGGQVSTTPSKDNIEDLWRVKVASHASVWWLQNPSKPFEAITASLVSPS